MKTEIAAAAAFLAFAGLGACDRGDQARGGVGGGPREQQSQVATAWAGGYPDRGVMRPIDPTSGTGPASAPFAHATASDPTGALQVYGDENADTFRSHLHAPTAIGGGPPPESVEDEPAHAGGK